MTQQMKRLVTSAAGLVLASALAFVPVSPSADGTLEMDEVCGLDASGMPNCVPQPSWKCTHGRYQWSDQCDPDVPDTLCTPPV